MSLTRDTKIGAVLAAVCAVMTPSAAPAQSYDSMYPTATQSANCSNQAMNFGMPCQQEDTTITIFIQDSLSVQGLLNIVNDIGWEFDPTDLNFAYQNPPNYDDSGTFPRELETDIIYQMNSGVAPNFGAMTWCDSRSNTFSGGGPGSPIVYRRCDQTYVAFAPVVYGSTPTTDIACHETGHAVGLNHGSWSSPVQNDTTFSFRCMRHPFPAGEDYVGVYNQTQINNTY